jgi:hypothetical protein
MDRDSFSDSGTSRQVVEASSRKASRAALGRKEKG